jgi:hypothetical protein
MKIGEFELELRAFEPFEVLPFMPFFQRYLNVVMNVRTDLRKEIEKKEAVLKKHPDDTKTQDELDTLNNLLSSEVETSSIKMFKNFNAYEWRELKQFIVSHITSWNLQVKNKDGEYIEAPVTAESFDKIPIYLIPAILMNVSIEVLGNGSEINFSSDTSKKKSEKQK